MYKTRMDYESPTADVFELRSRGIVCQSPGAWDNSITQGTNWGNDTEDYGLE